MFRLWDRSNKLIVYAGFMLAAACGGQTPSPSPAVEPASEQAGFETSSQTLSPAEVLETSTADDWTAFDPDNLLIITLERGEVIVALSEQLAPAHVARVKTLARDGFYDGKSFYRVIDGFVAQGDNAGYPLLTEEFESPLTSDMSVAYHKDKDGYSERVGILDGAQVGVDTAAQTIWSLHCTGAFAFGRENEKDSASTEFYIALQPLRYLDRNLSVFGRVISGMEHVQQLRRVLPPETEDDDKGEIILSMRLASDRPVAEQPRFEYLRDDSAALANYFEARRNRPEEFFYYRPDYLEICAYAVPVRETNDSN